MNTVYVIDDDQGIRRAVMALAEGMGMKSVGLRTAEKFLQAGPVARPSCLVLDIMLDGMNGDELLEHIARTESPIPTIMISAFADVPTTVRTMEAGAITLLEKPCPQLHLADAIKNAMAWDIRQMEINQRLCELNTFKEKLSKREQKVLDRLVSGGPNKSIARALEVSERTIEGDRAKILRKFDAENAVELAAKYTECKMLADRNYRFDRSLLMAPLHWHSSTKRVSEEN